MVLNFNCYFYPPSLIYHKSNEVKKIVKFFLLTISLDDDLIVLLPNRLFFAPN